MATDKETFPISVVNYPVTNNPPIIENVKDQVFEVGVTNYYRIVAIDPDLEDMDGLARRSTDMVKLGSFCTVFSATEVLENIRNGRKVEDIVKGLFFSVIKRVMEMDSMTDKVVMTGGVVANNAYLVKMAEELLGRSILVPRHPHLTGAIGAALYAMEDVEADGGAS